MEFKVKCPAQVVLIIGVQRFFLCLYEGAPILSLATGKTTPSFTEQING